MGGPESGTHAGPVEVQNGPILTPEASRLLAVAKAIRDALAARSGKPLPPAVWRELGDALAALES